MTRRVQFWVDVFTPVFDLLLFRPLSWLWRQMQPKPKPKLAPRAYTPTSPRKSIKDRHFELAEEIRQTYREREQRPGALDEAIAACREQIKLAPQMVQWFRSQADELNRYSLKYNKTSLTASAWDLPGHTGFSQLAIVLEKQGRYEEAIELCEKALAQGWADNWEGRIARCQKKLAKLT
jgi:tetratricopeptide (TPR) repeat protein